MPSLLEIVTQLQTEVPKYTNTFTTSVTVTSAEILLSGNLQLTLASNPFIAGNTIFISPITVRNKITDVTLNGNGTLTFITEEEHDLTAFMSERAGRQWPSGLSVQVLGVEPAPKTYNLLPSTFGVPDRNSFVTETGYDLPTDLEGVYLLETRSVGVSLSGLATVLSSAGLVIVVDTSQVPSMPVGQVSVAFVVSSMRIHAASSIERAEAIYTSQNANAATLFVIYEDGKASKSNMMVDDRVTSPESHLREIMIIRQFSVLVLLPTASDISGAVAQQLATTTIFDILFKSLYGWQKTGYISDGQIRYNTSYYGHAYEWETMTTINGSSGFRDIRSVALRDIYFTQTTQEKGISDATIRLQYES